MSFAPPRRATWLCLAALLLASSCRSQRYFMGFELPAGEQAELLVLGRQLRIQVDNAGPGRVRLDFDPPGDTRDEAVDIGVGTTLRSMPGPVRLRCTASAQAGTKVDVRAWGCEGMSLDQTPGPPAPAGPPR